MHRVPRACVIMGPIRIAVHNAGVDVAVRRTNCRRHHPTQGQTTAPKPRSVPNNRHRRRSTALRNGSSDSWNPMSGLPWRHEQVQERTHPGTRGLQAPGRSTRTRVDLSGVQQTTRPSESTSRSHQCSWGVPVASSGPPTHRRKRAASQVSPHVGATGPKRRRPWPRPQRGGAGR